MKNAYLRVFVFILGFVAFVSAVAEAANYTGTVLVKRNQAREIVDCAIITDKINAAGKPVGVRLALDENGKAIAQQYENQKVSLEGSLGPDKHFKATTWKLVKDTSYANEKYTPEPEPKSRRESADKDEEEEIENAKKEVRRARKDSRRKSSKKGEDDEDEDSEAEEAEEPEESDDNSDDESNDDDNEKSDDDDSEKDDSDRDEDEDKEDVEDPEEEE